MLYIVATPIGNLSDITQRAIKTLAEADYILCEDTRVSAKLLNRCNIKNNLIPFNEFNEESKSKNAISDLLNEKNIALISDAGTPLISDPGYKLIREAVQKNIRIEAIPGPSAVICALILSAKPPDKFFFAGYLPKKDSKRKKFLEDLLTMTKIAKFTMIFYESPYRLLQTLTAIKEVFGDCDIAVCREMTKLHEEIRREKISSAIAHFTRIPAKGELTLVI